MKNYENKAKERKRDKIFIISLIGRGGTYQCASLIASNLSGMTDVYMTIPSYSKTDLIDKKVILHKTYAPPDPLRTILSTLNIFQHIKNIRTINSSGAKTIIFADIHPWYVLYWPFIKDKTKVSIIHDAEIHAGEGSWMMNSVLSKITDFLIKKSDKIIALSKSQMELIRKKGWQKNIILSRHGNFDFFTRYELRNMKREDRTMLFFGRIKDYKGLDLLLDTLKTMKNTKFKLIIAGEGDMGPYMERIKSLGEKIELHNTYISDEKVHEFFQRAAFVVMPYHEATQTGIIPIAYSFKRPVIVTRVGSLPDEVMDGKTGMVIAKDDTNVLKDAITKMLKNPHKTAQMGEEGYRFMKKELDWGKITEKLYKDIER